jgi:hypothetical protein
MAAKSSSHEAKKHYTAMVYFHGIGQQKRYEEVSRLVDGLDRYEREHNVKSGLVLNKESSIQFEPTHPDLEESLGRSTVGYIPVVRHDKEYRFYEAYYADLFAGGLRPTEVLFWLLKLSFRPVRILFTRWRELPGLRRAILLGDWARRRKNASSDEEKLSLDREVEQLLDVYDDFVQSHQPAPFSKGSFWQDCISSLKRFFIEGSYGQFSKHLPKFSKKHARKNSNPEQFKSHARHWGIQFLKVQLKIIQLVLTTLLTLGLGLLGIGTFIAHIPDQPLWENILEGVIILFVVWGLSVFLRNYAGDLYFWTSYEETSEKYRKREAVMHRCGGYLKHILLDPNCERIVLVSHSMGTTVAHATLLRLGRAEPKSKSNQGSQALALERIQHFVTLASVIDKVYYLFETVMSKSHTYDRVIDTTTRGDLGTHPFAGTKNSQIPRIHWINFWDRADVASSALYTPADYEFKPYYVVDNYEVAGSCFPDPSSAHLDYFKNKTVLEEIFKVFFQNEYSFVHLPKLASLSAEQMKTNIQERFIGGKEKQHRFTNVFQIVVSLTPWLILLYLIGSRFIPAIASIPIIPTLPLYLLVVLVFGFLDWVLRYWKNGAVA